VAGVIDRHRSDVARGASSEDKAPDSVGHAEQRRECHPHRSLRAVRAREALGVLRTWMDSYIQPAFDGRILPVDTAVALRCARLHVPDRRSDRDALIAATALVHGLTVATRNVADFRAMGVSLLNPWEA
jgi:predicted nucleic acid-binding protein